MTRNINNDVVCVYSTFPTSTIMYDTYYTIRRPQAVTVVFTSTIAYIIIMIYNT